MNTYKGYLIDLDGTMYRGTESIEAAVHFVEKLNEKDIPYLFVTNNASKTPEQIFEILQGFKIPSSVEHVFTSSLAAANELNEVHPGAKVYMIGEIGLQKALIEKGFILTDENPDFVIIGLDREINYDKYAKACLAIRNGATFYSTNGDKAIPTERGLLPGNGALTSVITVSTGVEPIFIGKPEKTIMEQALKVIGLSRDEAIMVGDNYHTDILAGIRSGIHTLLVHSGVTLKEDLLVEEIQPTYVVDSLEEWVQRI